MENTGRLAHALFERDNEPVWYVAIGKERWLGPMPGLEIWEGIQAGELSWAHYVWRKDMAGWERVCDVAPFKKLVPSTPGTKLMREIKQSSNSRGGDSSRGSGKTKRPEVRQAQVPPPARAWFLYYNDSQFGPFSEDEIAGFLSAGKIHPRVHAWRDGMADWKRIQELPAFGHAVKDAAGAYEQRKQGHGRGAASPPGFVLEMPSITMEGGDAPADPIGGRGGSRSGARRGSGREDTSEIRPRSRDAGARGGTGTRSGATREAPTQVSEQRGAPRRPLVARIIMANDGIVVSGVCRDISVGGMQVLTDQLPGPVGTSLRLNVSPAAPSAKTGRLKVRGGRGGGEGIQPFTAEGVIVRILEDRRGFSFRFQKLSGAARTAIVAYIDGGGDEG